MEFTVNTTAFKQAAQHVNRLISTKAAQPSLTCIKISATEKGITLIAGNAMMFMKRFLPCVDNSDQNFQVIKPGSVLISPTYFIDIIQKLPMKLHLKVNKSFQLTIESERITTTLGGMDPSEYPELPIIEPDNKIYIHVDDFKQTADQTIAAVSHHHGNPALTGVNWLFDEQTWYSIATNSQRLVLTKQPNKESRIEGSYVLPAKAIAECLYNFKDNTKEIAVTFSNRYVLFQGENIEIYSSLIASSFPDVKRLIPTESTTEIIVETTKFLEGIERMSLIAATKKNHNVTMAIASNNSITLQSDAGEVGEIMEKQSAIQLMGDTDLQIIFDGQYMKESLRVINDEFIKLSFAGPFRPLRIEPLKDDSFLHLISPLRG